MANLATNRVSRPYDSDRLCPKFSSDSGYGDGIRTAGTWQPAPARQSGYTEEQFRGLKERVIANQHRDDLSGAEYEHVGTSHGAGANGEKIAEESLPGGADRKRSAEAGGEGRRQGRRGRLLPEGIAGVEAAVGGGVEPDDWRTKSSQAKTAKKMQDRAEMVDSASNALRFTWLRRESFEGLECDLFQMEPNPGYQPQYGLRTYSRMCGGRRGWM